jgi:hypothetical protein
MPGRIGDFRDTLLGSTDRRLEKFALTPASASGSAIRVAPGRRRWPALGRVGRSRCRQTNAETRRTPANPNSSKEMYPEPRLSPSPAVGKHLQMTDRRSPSSRRRSSSIGRRLPTTGRRSSSSRRRRPADLGDPPTDIFPPSTLDGQPAADAKRSNLQKSRRARPARRGDADLAGALSDPGEPRRSPYPAGDNRPCSISRQP